MANKIGLKFNKNGQKSFQTMAAITKPFHDVTMDKFEELKQWLVAIKCTNSNSEFLLKYKNPL